MYIFNPEHDLCLANGDIHFVPPESALTFGRDCASLVKFMHGLDNEEVNKIIPWGWNEVLRNRLLKEGYAEELLPSENQIESIRELSHRRVALEALEYLNRVGAEVISSDYRMAAKSLEELAAFVQKWRHVVLKAPLSGSGKGIRFVSERLSHSDAGWCRNLIAKHGYVVIEQRLNPILEFAMLFRCSSGVEFMGYSLFYTQNGAYRGNILASNEFIEMQICKYISKEVLEKSRLAITDFLKAKLVGRYTGFVGVDQFVYTGFNRLQSDIYGSEKYCLNPVVEINMRMTMGLVARNIYDRFYSEYNLGDGDSCFEICRDKDGGKMVYSYKIAKISQ